MGAEMHRMIFTRNRVVVIVERILDVERILVAVVLERIANEVSGRCGCDRWL